MTIRTGFIYPALLLLCAWTAQAGELRLESITLAGMPRPAQPGGEIVPARVTGIEDTARATAAAGVRQDAALRKIRLNEYQPEDDSTVIVKLRKNMDGDSAIREIIRAGFRAQAYNDNLGGYYIVIDVTGNDAAAGAIALAQYPFVARVLVGRNVYTALFHAV